MLTPVGRAVLAAASLALLLRLFAAWAIPLAAGARDPNCAPDEAWHFWVAKDLAAGSAPTWPDAWSIYAAFPPNQYALHALTLSLARIGLDVPWSYRFPLAYPSARGYPLARLGSVALGVATVILLAMATHVWTRAAREVLVAGVVAASYPQLIFVGGYTNADAFTIAAGALLIFALSRWAVAGETGVGLALVGLALGAVVIGKPSGYFTLPATGLWLAAATRRGTISRKSLVTLGGAALLVAAPFLAWNTVRNQGDVLGLGTYARFLAHSWERSSPDSVADPIWVFATTLTRSAIGTAGNMDRPLPPPLIQATLVLLTIGLGVALRWRSRLGLVARRWSLWIASSIVINLGLVIYNCWYVDFQPQGRYVLLSMVGLNIIAACAPSVLGNSRTTRAWSYGYMAFMLGAGLTMEAILWLDPCVGVPPLR